MDSMLGDPSSAVIVALGIESSFNVLRPVPHPRSTIRRLGGEDCPCADPGLEMQASFSACLVARERNSGRSVKR